MSLADDLAALRLNGVTDALFFDNGQLRRVIMGPVAGPFIDEAPADERGTMSLPTEVSGGGRPRGGPATAPRQATTDKPKDLMRDLILADLAAAPPMDVNDLPEEPEIDEPEQSGEATEGVEARDDLGDGGQPPLSPAEAEERPGQGH